MSDTDMALLCYGFRPLPGQPVAQQSSGSLGRTEGPVEQSAQLARRLLGGQTLEVRATNPSVAHDLPAWGYKLLQQDGNRYVIGRTRKEV